jgi:hypothetical protein
VTIDTSQNVGIGTSNPIGVSGYQGITIGGSTGGLIRLQSGASTQNAQIAANTSGFEIECVNTGIPMKFYTGGSERLRLDTSGNLGLGVTPSAWGLGKALQIAGSTGFLGFSGTNGNIVTNGYYDGSNYRYINSVHANMTTQSGGAHNWFNAPSGTAGNAITFTQAMTLDASGNLGVGTTLISYRLEAASGAGAYWNSSNGWTGGIPTAVVAKNTATGGYDPVFIGQMTDSAGTSKNSFAIGTVGTNSWTAGNNASQVADLYIAVRNNSGGISERARINSSGNMGIGATSITSGGGWTPRLVLEGATAAMLVKGGGAQEASVGSSNSMYIDCLGSTTGTNNNIIFRNTSSNSSFTAVERARIDSSGNFGIGTTPSFKLDVYRGSSGVVLNLEGVNAYDAETGLTFSAGRAKISGFLNGTGGTPGASLRFFTMPDGGSVTERGRFTSAGDFQLYITPAKDGQVQWASGGGGAVQALIYANGNPELIAQCGGSGGVKLTSGATSWVSASDIRNKNIIEPITNAVTKVATLSSVIYSFKDDEQQTRRVGLVAQELLAVLPEAVYVPEKEEELLGVRYTEVIPLLVAAIKEQQAIIQQLQADVAALKGTA